MKELILFIEKEPKNYSNYVCMTLKELTDENKSIWDDEFLKEIYSGDFKHDRAHVKINDYIYDLKDEGVKFRLTTKTTILEEEVYN